MSAQSRHNNTDDQIPLRPQSRGRRSNGEGSVYQRKTDGRWVATLRVNGKRLYFYGATRSEVEKKRRAAIIAQEKGELATEGSARQTVQQFLESWLEIKRASLKDISHRGYQQVSHRIAPWIGTIPLKKLTTAHIQSLYAKLHQQGLGPNSIRLVHRVLSAALKDAVAWRYIGSNPAQYVIPPRERGQHISSLTRDQAEDLMWAAKGTPIECLIILATVTGMRRGELLALRWADIDLEGKSLQVRHNVVYVPRQGNSGFVEGEPKTASSKRTIALPLIVVDALRTHRTHQLEARHKAGSGWSDKDLVFCNPRTGNFLSYEALYRLFRAVLAKALLPPMRFHHLRHSAATILLSIGAPVKVVQELLGHSNVQMTLNIYAHVLPGLQRQVMDQIDGLYLGKQEHQSESSA